ncbi:exodeoxyribonuclease VII small subunit [Fusibacter sp. JL298sf-3]
MKEQTFESQMEALKTIVEQMEKGDLPLDKLLALYEAGIDAYKNCHKMIEQTQGKIEKLNRALDEEQ